MELCLFLLLFVMVVTFFCDCLIVAFILFRITDDLLCSMAANSGDNSFMSVLFMSDCLQRDSGIFLRDGELRVSFFDLHVSFLVPFTDNTNMACPLFS